MSRTITGCVSRLRKDVSAAGGHTIYSLFFDCTVDRTPRPAKMFRVCGEVWGARQAILASRVQDGSKVVMIGCPKQGGGFDLELLVEVA